MALSMLVISIMAQCWAAILALILMRRTGYIGAWLCVAAALFLMGIRLAVSLVGAFGPGTMAIDPGAEGVAMLISFLMLAGVWKIGVVFDSIRDLRDRSENLAGKNRQTEADLLVSMRLADQAATRLQESEAQLRFLSDNLPDGLLYQIDSGVDGSTRKFTYVSAGILQLHELSPSEALADASLLYNQVCEEDRRLVAERESTAVKTMSAFNAEIQVILPSGKKRWRLFTSAPRRLADNHLVWDGIEIDITDSKLAGEERHRSHSLESLGTLAGGIAHNFNNLLMGIFGNIELARLNLPPDHPACEPLHTALQSLENTTRLTSRLLTFSRGGDPARIRVDLRNIIRDTVSFSLAGSNVAATFDIDDDLWPVTADAGQLAQVIASLALNAREAMPDGGIIRVLARNIRDLHLPAAPHLRGDFVKFCVKDQGVGIPPQIIGKIYDPYFTTKHSGHGLGLAIAHGIITRHKGYIQVESTPHAGTTVGVFLPVGSMESALGRVSVSPPA